MSGFACTVLLLVIFIAIGPSHSLVELPKVGENDILNTEIIIRSTANKLFAGIKLKRVKNNPKLKQYQLIHNYFVSRTLKDYKNLKEIAKITRVDKNKIDNTSINFIDLINEILNEDSLGFETKSETSLNNAFNNEVESYIDDYSHNIAYLKATYGDNSPRVGINENIIDILKKDGFYLNKTAIGYQDSSLAGDNETLLEESDFWVPDDSRRIFQGKRTRIRYFPFMASIAMFNQFQCSGSIISDDLVITAASCLQLAWNNRLFRENPSFLSVRIGSDYYDGGGENLPALEVYFYPTYNPKNLRNNIAVIRLIRKIFYPSKKRKRSLKKIDFDRRESPLPMNLNGVTIVGWGAKTATNIVGNPWENKLSFSNLDVYLLKDCQDTYSSDYVTDLNFCAGFLSKGGGACSRDVGSPGIVGGVLTGIVSFGAPVCGTADAPTVFTKVGYYANWIEEIMQQDVPYILNPTTLRTTRITIYPEYSTPQNALEISIRPYDVEFKQFLKTMFNSKEIDDYLDMTDNDLDAVKKNSDIIDIRQEQLAQNGPYFLPQKRYDSITPVSNTEGVKVTYYPTIADESFKALESSTKVDDIQIFNPENNIDLNTESSKENNDLNTAFSIENNVDYNINSEENPNERNDLEDNIMNLIENVNLKEKIAEASNKDATINKDQDLDNTMLSFLQTSDSENQHPNFNDLNTVNNINLYNHNYVNDNEFNADHDLKDETDNIYDHQESRLDDKRDPNQEDGNINLKSSNVGGLSDIFSKNALFDILSDVIDYHPNNKSNNK